MTQKILKAIYEGTLDLNGYKIPCAVLEDGQRVLSQRGVNTAFGRSAPSTTAEEKLPAIIALKTLQPFISKELRLKASEKKYYITKGNFKAIAIPAALLPEICDVWLEACDAQALTESQKKTAKKAEILMRGLAYVGIIALVDEATGFIKDKAKFEYRELFREFIREQAAQYEKQFPDEFYDMFYRIYEYPRLSKKSNRHPLFFSKLTRKYVYEPLAGSNGAILEMLDDKNPVIITTSGTKKRKYKFFQFLEKIGKDSLQQHMWQLIGIGKASPNKKIFDRNFSRTFAKNFQKEMFDE